jgi:hypothetical protein
VDGTDDVLWNDSEEDGCECMKMKALTVKMETLTLVDVDRIRHASCIKCLNSKIFIFCRRFIFGESS